MVHSRLPVPSLPCLFGALLMLSPGLLVWSTQLFVDKPTTDPDVKKVLAFIVEQYNHDRGHFPNYYKLLRVLKSQLLVIGKPQYYLTLHLIETTCRKEIDRIVRFKEIQECNVFPGIHKTQHCYFRVPPSPVLGKDYLISKCVLFELPDDPVCPGKGF